ncbi:IS110 family transposase [Burkholderia sp. Bp9143]|uniref:IS110 family transposase n=1 Tax=Burkholderia sp. Bp9143 TaxID=2184574 RepID=UPI000F5AA6EA|nr:IS110 family transposase [Burkholderia sp. Bp9143]RQR31106.1 IS110 family transposase [Burkholderia sp. Bp9143]
MNSPFTIGIDLAKEVFAICVLDERGAVLERRVLRRAAFERWAVQAPDGVIAMESCSSAHHWGCWFSARGHVVRLIAPEFVTPFRKGGKNDAADAEAIAVAARQPTMRFVTVKTVEQQAILSWHRARQGWVDERTALINRLRGLLAEFGIVLGRSRSTLRTALPRLTEDARLPAQVRALLLEAREQFAALDDRVARCDAEIAAHLVDSAPAQRLRALLGIGPLTASALVATVSNASSFKNGRQFGAWLGLTPQQHSSGGKARLGKVTRHGDGYLRSLLVQGARSALQSALRCLPERLSRLGRWIVDLCHRKGYHKTLVAIANKHARMLWAMLAHDETYDPLAWQRYRAPAATV